MANMTNIKTKIYILVTAAALILCGCSDSQPPLNADVSSAITTSLSETEETVKPAESENSTETEKITEAKQTAEPEETAGPMASMPADKFEVPDIFEVREYPDDNMVPDNWMPIYSLAEAAENFHEIVSADVSNMDTADAIIALANKNVIFVDTFQSDIFWNFDLDHPYYSENYKNPYASDNPYYADLPLYPIIWSPGYYTNIQEIYDLGSETYMDNALNDETNGFYYDKGKPRKPFMKENVVSYVDGGVLPIWNLTPFRFRSYIEIVSETEDKCSFIWHTPNWEMLGDPPEEGWEFHYYSCPAEAVYEDGSWKLSKVYVEGYSLKEPFEP